MSDNGNGNPNPTNCPYYGKLVPDGHNCKGCQVPEACYAAYDEAQDIPIDGYTPHVIELTPADIAAAWDGWQIPAIIVYCLKRGCALEDVAQLVDTIRAGRELRDSTVTVSDVMAGRGPLSGTGLYDDEPNPATVAPEWQPCRMAVDLVMSL